MDIGDLRKRVAYLSPEMRVNVVAHNKTFDFSISFGGGSDGGDDFDTLCFYVDELCQSERSTQKETLEVKPPTSPNNAPDEGLVEPILKMEERLECAENLLKKMEERLECVERIMRDLLMR